MRAVTINGPKSLSVDDIPVPQIGPEDLLVSVRLWGLCGTDLGFFDGTSNYLHDGYKSYPFVPGHEWVGTVVDVGRDVPAGLVGKRVAGHNFRPCGRCGRCRDGAIKYCPDRSELGVLGDQTGAAAEFVAVPQASVEVIPDQISDAAATLLEPTAAAMHAVERVAVTAKDAVAVVGAGTLGLAAAQIARARGARVTVIDPSTAALRLADSLGFEAISQPGPDDQGRFDVVIEASGASTALATALMVAGSGARIAQLGTPHAPVDGIPLADLVIREITVFGVLSGVGHWRSLIDLVVAGQVELDVLVDHVYPLDQVTTAFERLADRRRERPKVIVDLQKET